MKRYIPLLLAVLWLTACKEEMMKPAYNDATAPDQVTKITEEPIPGGSRLTYVLPSSTNLLYILAEVTNKQGVVRQFKASYYTNTLQIEGLGDTSPYEVKLYSVNKSEVRSAPVTVTIHPLQPPFADVFKSFVMNADFGGVNLKFSNPTGLELEIGFCGPDSVQKGISLLDTYFTATKDGNHTFRGLPPNKARFGVFIRDKWGNTSDTLFQELTPLYEKMLDKSKFREIKLPGDGPVYTTEWNIAYRFLWDGKYSSSFSNPYDGNGNNWQNLSTNGPSDGTPIHITIDLGETAHISRFRINHYYRFTHKALRKYELWGSNNPPADGSWDNWTKILYYEQEKPSGLQGEQYNDADAEVWLRGDMANFPDGLPAFRYIRVKCLENWMGNGNMSFSEITFWGDTK
ncbi:DUF5000 domain-containing lipoprotein [Chitinophaga sp. HK235]|uniref:DUF5000 domain-containing lipoprotein n=1 Tax=Chitinophaga sp. HK235 TaxID=2952571 RepID=UPI001BA6EF7B|nr:DUF5000 domain-containing lipoprotein [Chitinophaga sp. HK235]